MVENHREAYIIAGVVSFLAYIVLLALFHIVCYCMRKCPSCLTGRQPVGRDPEANKQAPQQAERRVIFLTTKDLMDQGITIPGMTPANLNNSMTTQHYGQNGTVGNTQNFLTQEQMRQNIERVPLNNGGYPVNLHQFTPTAPPNF